MRIVLDGGAEQDRNVMVLVYTYDPSEHALAAAMWRWCDDYLEGCETHQSNVDRVGYLGSAHCDGFDLTATGQNIRRFLNSWRRFFEPHPDLDLVDRRIGRASEVR